MHTRKSTVFSRNRKRHLLALSLVTLSVGGCASGPVRPNGSRHAAVSRPAVSGESLGDELPQPAPTASNESNFRTVGYGQPPRSSEVVLATQLDLAPPMRLGDEEEDQPKTLGEMLENEEEEDGEQGRRVTRRR